jgi:hypothetical protein
MSEPRESHRSRTFCSFHKRAAHLWNAYTFDRLPLVVLSLASDSAQKRFPINSPARLAESVELSLVLER